jgi:hypothetical protein
MLSYQIYVGSTWFHCEERSDYYNHKGHCRTVFLTPSCYKELVDSGELVVKSAPKY